MPNHKIVFENIGWESPNKGVTQKAFHKGKKKLRLLRFDEDFVENDWCLKGHVGYVLEGKMEINFNGKVQEYKKNDGLWIEEGASNKHKVIIKKGTFVTLILFESE